MRVWRNALATLTRRPAGALSAALARRRAGDATAAAGPRGCASALRRVSALALLLWLAAWLALPAAAQQPPSEPRWFTDDGSARWGIPETDAVGFEVVCRTDGVIAIRPALYALERPATPPLVDFVIDGESYLRLADLEYSERDAAWQATAKIARADRLVSALRRGTSVTYDFSPQQRQGDQFTVPLSGSAKAIDEALADC